MVALCSALNVSFSPASAPAAVDAAAVVPVVYACRLQRMHWTHLDHPLTHNQE